jgi:hypothetical protein
MLQEPRKVHYQTIIELIKKRSMLLKMGAIFSLVGIVISLVFLIVFPLLGHDVPEVDYSIINEKGETITGTITNIETQYNVKINNQHPSIISYRYLTDGKSFESKFKTLSPDQVDKMEVGDSIPIKHLNGKSIIISLAPFSFPFGMFFTIPLVFLLIGLPCLLLLIYQIRNEIQLLKFGTITEAEVISMTHKPGLPISKIGHGVQIHYQYKTSYNKTYLANGFTSDLSLLNTIKQGDVIKIFVSSEDESKSTLISRLEAARNSWRID